ncbi:MAG: GNAT family N-acetyltransferase [Acidimicrobiales bacterium]
MPAWQGDKVRLRALEPDDVDAFVAADADTDTARAGWRIFPPRSEWGAREWVQQATQHANDGDEFRVAVESLASGDVVGTLNTHRCDPVHGTCSYGITIFSWAQHQGYGREAVVLVLRYLFGERRYQKCTVGVYGFNDGSVAFHEALGFRVEGRIRRAFFALGEHHDEVLLGITVEEFDKLWGLAGPVG